MVCHLRVYFALANIVRADEQGLVGDQLVVGSVEEGELLRGV